MKRQIEIEWPDFGVAVAADLLDDENPRLCEEFWQALPFETVFAASMSAGQMFKVPIPVSFSDDPDAKLVFFPDQAPGTILSLGFMGGLLVKYGTVAEPFRLPRLARIPDKELVKFQGVASKLRDAYFFTKVINRAVFKRKKTGAGTASRKAPARADSRR